MSKEQMIERVKKLLNKTESNGCTAAEAATALALAQKLMAQYGISDCDVSLEEEMGIIEEEVSVGTKSVSSMQGLMAMGLAKHFGCEVVLHTRYNGSQFLKFIGDKMKCEIFKETYLFAYRVFQKNWTSYCKSLDVDTKEKNRIRGDYFNGFLGGLTNELIRSENEHGLVIVKSEELKEYMNNMKLRGSKKCSVASNNSIDAFNKGYKDGSFSQRSKNKAVEQA